MRPARLLLLTAALAVACSSDAPLSPRLNPRIEDATHNGGNAHFYFLPPLVPPAQASGQSDGMLSPLVTVCEWTNDQCAAVVARFSTTAGTGSETVRYDAAGQQYIVNWHTDQCAGGPCALDPAKTYRLRVHVGLAQLGYADVDVVSSGNQLRNVQTNEYIGLLNGRTLPVKFRIEQGAVSVVEDGGSAAVGAAGGVVTSSDGTVGLDFPADAVNGIQPISISRVEEPAEGALGEAVDLGPDGTTFASPVTLTLSFDPATIPPEVPPESLSILLFDGEGWEAVPGSVANAATSTVSAEISHFSRYAIGISANNVSGNPPSITFAVGEQPTSSVSVFHVFCNPNCSHTPATNQAVNWTSLNPAILSVGARSYSNGGGIARPPNLAGRAPGSTILRASVNGPRGVVSVNIPFTVRPPMQLADMGDITVTRRTIGVGQQFGLDVILGVLPSAPVLAFPMHTNPTVVTTAPPGNFTIPAGQQTLRMLVSGRSLGSERMWVMTPGYGIDSIDLTVATGRVNLEGLPGTIMFGDSAPFIVRSINPVSPAPENVPATTFNLAASPNLRISDGTNVVTSATIPDGTSGSATLYARAVGTGTGTIDVTNAVFAPFQGVVNIAGQPVRWSPRTITTVAGWVNTIAFGVGSPMAGDVAVAVFNANSHATVRDAGGTITAGGQTGSYQLQAGTTSTQLTLIGAGAPGTDTLIASGPALLADSAFIDVILGRLRLNGWPSALQVGDSAPLEITVSDPVTGATGLLASAINVGLGASSGLIFTNGQTTITSIPIGVSTSAVFYVKAIAAGNQSVTLSHADYETYTNTTATSGLPVINPFPQAGQQFVLPVLPGTPGTGVAPISNLGTGVLGGLQVAGTPYICTSGAPLPWLTFAFDSPSAPTNLRVTASVPAGTTLGIYDFCFTLRATGAADRPYGVRVSVQQVVVPNPPVIDPFPQGRTQHSITVPAGGLGQRIVPVSNTGGSPLTGLALVGPVVNCSNGQPVTWLAHTWASTTAPTNLTLTATPPGSTPPGTYELCFQLQARAAGAMDKHYGINVIVQPALVGPQSVCGRDVTGIGYDGTYYYVGEGHNSLFQCLSRFNGATGQLSDTRIVSIDHRGMHWVPALGRVTSRTWGGPIFSVDLATGNRTQLATNPTVSRPGDEQVAPAVDQDGLSYWILTNGVVERRRLSDHVLLTSFPVTNTVTQVLAVSDLWVFVLENAFANAYSKATGLLAGRQPLPFAHGCAGYGFGASASADRLMILRNCRLVEIVPVTVTFQEPVPTYTMTDLGTLGGTGTSEAVTINASGRIVGTSNQRGFYMDAGSAAPIQVPNPFGDIWFAHDVNAAGVIAAMNPYTGYLWDPATNSITGPPPGPFAQNNRKTVWALNDAGQVLACADNGAFYQSYIWTVAAGTTTLIPNATNWCLGRINRNGVAIVSTDPGGGGNSRLWNQSTQQVTMIPSLGGLTIGRDLNAASIAVGSSTVGGLRRAFRFDPATGQTQNLGTLGGNESEALGINDAGVIVGWSRNAAGQQRGFIWLPALQRMFELPVLPGHDEGHANDVNDAGQIVGYSAVAGSRRAVRWNPI